MKGKINVQSENIFPIIKKFLYSEHDIFLRELVSNAVDATQKIKTLAARGEVKGELGELEIEVAVDTEKGTLRISDSGIGMSTEEVERYINQIAFSGAKEFLDKYKDENTGIIGYFGLGFYSAFMVAAQVEIQSLSYQEGAEPVQWLCDGTPEYEMNTGTRSTRGTDIILHLNEDSKEFLEAERVKEVLNRYCKFLPVPIRFGDEIINHTQPAWTKKPADLSDEDYKNFYRELYPYQMEEPLFWIHLNVDFPFRLTGILYFPPFKNTFDPKRSKISLYANQVFVTDNVEGIVPEYLMLLHGVMDSPDIPLNVSRSYLQGDRRVKQISDYITKKVASKLEEIFKNDREEYEKKWDNIGVFVKYGMLSDEKFAEKAKKITLFENTAHRHFTLEEYATQVKPLQTDKNNKIVALYTSQAQEQDAYIRSAQARGYEVLLMEHIIDTHVVAYLDYNNDYELVFKRVDADTADNLVEKDEQQVSVLTEDQEHELRDLFAKSINDTHITVATKAAAPDDYPVLITKPEFMRRMREMSMHNNNGNDSLLMPDTYQVVLNSNHPLFGKMLQQADESRRNDLVRQLLDLALLQQNMLKGSRLTDFVRRSLAWADDTP
ncbi:MAG: molecular chaperone HtpG [Sphingobacteriales bacterium]|nr:molecular chaperone HtpG [Sphingobacteriales bacterium]